MVICEAPQWCIQYLVLEQGPPKGPDRSKDKVELIKFLCTIWGGVFWGQQTL